MQLAFMVVLFGGLAYMFLIILRTQDAMLRTLREDNARLSARLLRLEHLLTAQNPEGCSGMQNNDACSLQSDIPAFHAEAGNPAFQDRTPLPDTARLPHRNLKKWFADSIDRISGDRQERTSHSRKRNAGERLAEPSGRTDGLRLDWPEPSASKHSHSDADGGMPELRL